MPVIPPQLSQTKLTPDIAKCHLGAKLPSVENPALEYGNLFILPFPEAVTEPDT